MQTKWTLKSTVMLSALALTAYGCGSSTKKTSSFDMATSNDLAVVDMAVTEDLAPIAGDMPHVVSDLAHVGDLASVPMSTLTLTNYFAWCDISVNGGTPFASQSMPIPLPTGSTVTLTVPFTIDDADFQWGYWQGASTGADMAAFVPGTGVDHQVSFTLTGNKTVNACCPDKGAPFGTGCP